MKIIRYSKYGFKPQYQNYHLQTYVDYHLNNFDVSVFPEHSRSFILDKHNKLILFYHNYYNNLQYGVWAFIDGYKNNRSLNHLDECVPCWEAEIDNNAIVFNVNWDETLYISDAKCELFGFFVPVNTMHLITNIRRKPKN